jgi:NADPH-dependent curcumin reductase CurA
VVVDDPVGVGEDDTVVLEGAAGDDGQAVAAELALESQAAIGFVGGDDALRLLSPWFLEYGGNRRVVTPTRNCVVSGAAATV